MSPTKGEQMRMKKVAVLGVSLVVGLVATASGAGSAGPATVLKANTMERA
jgi:hypothetical protein